MKAKKQLWFIPLTIITIASFLACYAVNLQLHPPFMPQNKALTLIEKSSGMKSESAGQKTKLEDKLKAVKANNKKIEDGVVSTVDVVNYINGLSTSDVVIEASIREDYDGAMTHTNEILVSVAGDPKAVVAKLAEKYSSNLVGYDYIYYSSTQASIVLRVYNGG